LFRRIWALVLRYLYIHRRSPARIMEIFFWPVMNLLVWGFVARYLGEITRASAVVYLLGAVVLWDVLYRSQQAVSLSITEEYWVRNIINLFVSPLAAWEIVAAACAVGFLRALVMTVSSAVLVRVIFGFNILAIGPALGWFYMMLVLFGWGVGLFTMGLVFRFGRAAEALIWGVPFLIQPFSAVFYPVSVLPQWLQWVALSLPSTHVFEGMRAALAGQPVSWGRFLLALGLNLGFMATGALFFAWMLDQVRKRGTLARQPME